MAIINELGRRLYSDPATAELDPPSVVSNWPGSYFDTNADGKATALDALRVINELGRLRSGEGEEVAALVNDLAISNLVDDQMSDMSRLSEVRTSGTGKITDNSVVELGGRFAKNGKGQVELSTEPTNRQENISAIDDVLASEIEIDLA